MKKSELRKIIKEELQKINEVSDNQKVNNIFSDVIEHLRRKVYPGLNDDEVYELNIKIKEWFNRNVLESTRIK